ncbi:MAG TPA: porin [Planctomycetota bacterium]|nr:porin [Planctomycetota bacterium]
MRIPAAVLVVTAMWGAASTAWAQQDDKEKKMREESMKERLDAMEKKVNDSVTFSANNGLKFKTADGNFEGAIGGRFYFVYRNIFERVDLGTTAANGFIVDTARIQVDGTFMKEFYYRVEAEAGKGADFFLKDGFVGWKGIENHSFQFGQFKEPFSQEENCSSRFNDFAERSLVNRLVPQHDVGMMWSGLFAEKVIGVELGFFNGNGRNQANENNDEKDLALRLRVSPFRASDNDMLKNLRFGIATTYGDVDNLALGDITGADYSNANMIDFTGVEDGIRQRIGIEVSWIFGSASVRAEYVTMNREVVVAADREDFDTTAYYLQFTYLLTGEAKAVENRIVPKNPFSVKNGTWGAWELAVRFASLDASDGEDVGVVGAAANQEVTEITLGVNWWMTSNVRLMLNYEMFTFDEDIPQTGGEPVGDQSIFYTRLQIDF